MKKIYQVPETVIIETELSMNILEDSGEIDKPTPEEPGILSNENNIFEEGNPSTSSSLWD